VLRLEASGLVEHADLNGVAAFHCNDMVVSADGRAYVGNFGFDLEAFVAEHGGALARGELLAPKANLARVDPDGSVHVAASDINFPNGTVITPDGKTLIIAETMGRCLTAFDIGAGGELSNRRLWANTGEALPDGICLDAEGAIWIANPRAPECLRIAEGGAVLDRVETSQPPFACMLGGPDRKTLCIVTAPGSGSAAAAAPKGKVEIAQVSVAGAGLP
jgi:sugar lactone lactonase YvrE